MHMRNTQRLRQIAHGLGLGLMLLFLSFPTYGEVFTWTDQNGNVHFGDTPPQNQPSKKLQLLKQSVGGLPALSEMELEEALRRSTQAYFRGLQDGRSHGDMKRLEEDVRQYQEERTRRSGLSYDEQCRLGYRRCSSQAAPSYTEQREREALQRRAAAEAEEERQQLTKQRVISQYPPDYLEYIQGQCYRGVKLYCAKLPPSQ